MWDDQKSITLSKLCVLFFMCALIGTAVSAPWLIRWFLGFSGAQLWGAKPYFLATVYIGCIPAAVLLYSMFRLLHRIENEQVFITENVEHLRRISWSCFASIISRGFL